MSMSDKRIGKFTVSIDLIDNHPNDVIYMFYYLKMIVIRAEMLYHIDSIEYYGICPLFDELKMGDAIIDYKIIAHKNNGEMTYTMEKYENR